MNGILRPQNWRKVWESVCSSSPFNFVVIDGFIGAENREQLHFALLQHWAWHRRNWISSHLHNSRPNVPIIGKIAECLLSKPVGVLQEMVVVDYWALLYANNIPGPIHADVSGYNLNLWVTPDEYNKNPDRGGLVLYDVKRAGSATDPSEVDPSAVRAFLSKHSSGETVRIPYRCNRAVLFDATTLHCTDKLDFDTSSPDGYRINLSIAFDRRKRAGDVER